MEGIGKMEYLERSFTISEINPEGECMNRTKKDKSTPVSHRHKIAKHQNKAKLFKEQVRWLASLKRRIQANNAKIFKTRS